MGRALQRLLARPSSLALLRCLIVEPTIEEAFRKSIRCPSTCSRHYQIRQLTTAIATAQGIQENVLENAESASVHHELLSVIPSKRRRQAHLTVAHQTAQVSPEDIIDGEWYPREWEECLWTSEELEIQSNMDLSPTQCRRLVDSQKFKQDANLWAYLLDFRKRRYGDDGVTMFWKAVRARSVDLPTSGPIADNLWITFLDMGLKNTKILSQICCYADELFDRHGTRWPSLYVYIMQHMVMGGRRNTMIHWHDRLTQNHSPEADIFYTFIRNIVSSKGDLKALRDIYKRHKYHKAYAEIIPLLLDQEDFSSAFDWHFFLTSRGDFPTTQKLVEPLIHHYAIFDPPKAVRLTRSLVTANVSFAASIISDLEDNKKISREMMNLIHGEAFHVKPKAYNDSLGARWFATRWVSLDLAINTLHALGVDSIGPLSLQAIAERENNPSGVVHRLDQLRELGISTGKSLFAKAVEAFARNNEAEYLRGLLKSDQHPETLEDWKLQESLLAAYERDQDWAQYHRTVAIRLVASANPRVEQYNMSLRKYVLNGDRAAILQSLEEMRSKGIAVTQLTIRYILRNILPPRRIGHISHPTLGHLNNIRAVISILTSIMKFNNFVPVRSWREIIRRLGMLGKLDEMEQLCLWLAKWYQSSDSFRSQVTGYSSPSLSLQSCHSVPNQVPTSHPLHPLRMLFSDDQQKAIVEWAFKYDKIRDLGKSIPASSSTAISRPSDLAAFTRGVALLRQLSQEGVYINLSSVRDALLNRLIILYGPGESNIVRNRVLKRQNALVVDEMVEELNQAWGKKIFPDINELKAKIGREGKKRIARSRKLDAHRMERRTIGITVV